MPRSLIVVIAALACVLGVLALAACDGDDEDENDTTNTPSASINPTDEPDESPNGGGAPPTSDDKTPGPEPTRDPNATAAPTPGDATPAETGIPALFIEDPTTWFAQNYPGVSPAQENCEYNIVNVTVSCSGVEYAPDPPPIGEGVDCFGMLVNNERVALRCNIPGVTTYYYDIQA